MTLFYLSFADEEFRGAVIVDDDGLDFLGAVSAAHRRGINPGGQVLGVPLAGVEFPAEFTNRLLTAEDVRALDRSQGGDGVAVRIDCEAVAGGGS